MSAARFEARSAMISRVSLSASARLLYMALDDMARERGEWFIRQDRLSVQLGCSRRMLQYHLSELTAAGHVIVRRTGRSAVYVLKWAADTQQVAHQETGRCATHCASDVQPVAPRILLRETGTFQPENGRITRCAACGQFHQGAEPARCGCGRVHSPEQHPAEDPLEITRRTLHDYVQRSGLSWPEPDEQICVQVLTAAGGLVPLVAQLRHLLNDRHQKPARSYAWFVKAAAVDQRRRA